MTKHQVGTREEWLAAREELLEREKDLTRRSDELARQRQDALQGRHGGGRPRVTSGPARPIRFESGGRGKDGPERLRALGWRRLPPVLPLRPRHRRAERDLAAARPGAARAVQGAERGRPAVGLA